MDVVLCLDFIEVREMLIPDLIIQMITVVIGVALYAAIFKILKNMIHKIIH